MIRAQCSFDQLRPSSCENSTFMTGPLPLKAIPCTRTGKRTAVAASVGHER